MTVDGISCPSESLISSAAERSEVMNPFVTFSGCCGETDSAVHSALCEGINPSSLSSVKYDEASSVARGSKRAERRKPSLHVAAGYDEASSVVPRPELGDRSNHRVRSSCRRRPSDARLRTAGGVDAGRRIHAPSGMTELSPGVADSSSEPLPSPEYTVH
jgi:hypothetical protein